MRQWIQPAEYGHEFIAGIERQDEICKIDQRRRRAGEEPIFPTFRLEREKTGVVMAVVFTPEDTIEDFHRAIQSIYQAFNGDGKQRAAHPALHLEDARR